MRNKIADITSRFFGRSGAKSENHGLYASLEELMEQRKNVVYLRQNNKLVPSKRAGDVKSAFKGRGIEMEEIRSYAPGDDVRDIDWRVTARKNNPYTKLYAEEKDREIYILLDLSSPMLFGTKKELKSVTAGKTAALLGWLAQENKDRLGGIIFDGKNSFSFKPQHNRAHLLSILKKISDISKKMLGKFDNLDNIKVPVQMLTQNIKSQSTVFIISDFNNFDDDVKKLIATLAKKSQVFCVNIFDVLEEKAPQKGEYMIENNGENLVFDTHPKQFRQEYQNYFSQKREQIKTFCHKFNCRYIEVRTDTPLFQQLRLG